MCEGSIVSRLRFRTKITEENKTGEKRNFNYLNSNESLLHNV